MVSPIQSPEWVRLKPQFAWTSGTALLPHGSFALSVWWQLLISAERYGYLRKSYRHGHNATLLAKRGVKYLFWPAGKKISSVAAGGKQAFTGNIAACRDVEVYRCTHDVIATLSIGDKERRAARNAPR